MKLRIFSLFIIAAALFLCAEDGSELYFQGKKEIEQNNVDNGRRFLSEYVTAYTDGAYLKDALLILIKTSSNEKLEEKIAYSEILSENFPEDMETQNIRIDLSNYYLKKKLYFESSKWLQEIIIFSDSISENSKKARKNLENIINSHLNPSELEYLLYNFNSDEFNPQILYKLYTIYNEMNETTKAEIFRQRLIKDYSESFYTRKYIFEIGETKNSKCKIALMIQLTGDFSQYGEQVKRGCVIANEEENLDVVIFDTEGSSVRTLELIDSIYRDESFTAVIGPISSQEAIVTGAYLFRDKILPVLSPTATDGEILRFENNLFLANKTLVEEAIFTAKYLKNQDIMQNIGIIYPDDSYGKTLANAFRKEAKRVGLNIIFEIGYPQGTQDFLEKISMIEKMKIDAIYLPVSSEDAILLSTQLAFKDVNALLIGSSSWKNENLIRLAKDYLKNAIMIAPKSVDSRSSNYNNFRVKYFKKYNGEPDRFSLLSYDTFKLIAMLVKNGYNSRKNITNYLKNMDYYDGVSGKISFSKNRMEFDVFTIKNSEFIKKE